MNRIRRLFILSVLLLAHYSLPAQASPTGTWRIQGSNSERGTFSGILQILSDQRAYRVIEYDTYKFQGLRVQEAWQGRVRPQGRMIDFKTQLSSYVTRSNEIKADLQTATKPVLVSLIWNETTNYTNADGSKTSETLMGSLNSVNPRLQPDFSFRLLDASNDGPPLVAKAVISLAKSKIGFDEDPFVRAMGQKPVCRAQKAQVVEDLTDRNFYFQIHDAIRALDSPANDLTLTASLYRRAAFSTDFVTKIKAAEEDMNRFYINPLGMNVYSRKNSAGAVSFDYDNDSALWTGEYVAYLAEQYQKRKSKDLLEKIKLSASGLMLLVEVFEKEQEFARTVEVFDAAKSWDDRWVRINTNTSPIMARKGGNNDMFKGIILGLISAHDAVPDDDVDFHARLRRVVRMILKLKLLDQKDNNKALAKGLAGAVLADMGLRLDYENFQDGLSASVTRQFDSSFYWNGATDYSGVNLGVVGTYADYVIARSLNSKLAMARARGRAIRFYETFSRLQHPLIILLNQKLGSTRVPDQDRIATLQFLDSIPYPRPEITVEYNHSAEENFCLSPIPRFFWKVVRYDYPVNYYYQSLTNFPVFSTAGISSNYLWKDAFFEFKGSAEREVSSSPTDILFAALLLGY